MGCVRCKRKQRFDRMLRCTPKNVAANASRRNFTQQNNWLLSENLINQEGAITNPDISKQLPQKSPSKNNKLKSFKSTEKSSADHTQLVTLEQRWVDDNNNNIFDSKNLHEFSKLPDKFDVIQQPVQIDTPYGTQYFQEGFDPQFVLINRAVMRARDPEEVIDIIQSAFNLNGVNIATALYKIQDLIMQEMDRTPKRKKRELITDEIEDFFQTYAQVYSKFQILRPRCICNILISCAMLRIHIPPKITRLYLKYARELIDLFKSKDLQDLALSITYLKIKNELSELLLHDIAARCIELGEDFSPKEMSVILWAFATLKFYTADVEYLCEIFAIQLIKKRKQIKTVEDLQVFSNSAWAFQQLGIEVKEVFKCLGILADSFRINLEVYSTDISEYRARVKIQAISCFLWVLAKYNIYVTNFMSELSKQIPKIMILVQNQQCNQFVSNLLYSFATLCHYDQQTLNSLSQYFYLNINFFKAQEISNCIWALGFLGYNKFKRQNLEIVKDKILVRLQSGDFTMIACGQLLFGFSMLQYMPLDLFFNLTYYIQQRYIQLQDTYDLEQLFNNVQIGYMTMEAQYDTQIIQNYQLTFDIKNNQIQDRDKTQKNDLADAIINSINNNNNKNNTQNNNINYQNKKQKIDKQCINNTADAEYNDDIAEKIDINQNHDVVNFADKETNSDHFQENNGNDSENTEKTFNDIKINNNNSNTLNSTQNENNNKFECSISTTSNNNININALKQFIKLPTITFSNLREILYLGRDAWRRMTQYCIQSESMLYSDIARILDILCVQYVQKTMTRNGCLWIYLCCLCDNQPTAIEVHRRASDLTYNGDHIPMGMGKWRVWQMRLRGWHVLEINGYDWGLFTVEERFEFLVQELLLMQNENLQQQ